MAAPSVATVKGLAAMKCGLPFGQAVMRGVLCNWLVVMGIWQATAAKDIVGKVFGIWLPISAFVTMGFEHSVANMFFLPMGLFQGAEVTWKMIFMNNLLPVTIGNTIACHLHGWVLCSHVWQAVQVRLLWPSLKALRCC